MKVIACIFVLLSAFSVTPEPTYRFSRHLVYEETYFRDTQTESSQVSFWVNDQDNAYHVRIDPTQAAKANLYLRDEKGVAYKAEIPYPLQPATVLEIPAENKMKYHNPYKYQVNNYDLTPMSDTVVNGHTYQRYKLHCTHAKRKKRKKIGHEVYLIDTTVNCKPMLTFVTAYEIVNLRQNLPNGLVVEQHYYDYNKVLRSSRKLLKNEPLEVEFRMD